MEYHDNLLHIGGISVADLASRFGTPLYVYDGAVFRGQMEKVRAAFADLPFRPFYAMKANSNVSPSPGLPPASRGTKWSGSAAMTPAGGDESGLIDI